MDWSKFLPAVTVYVHLYGGVDGDGIARIEGVGPLTEAWVREHLGPHAHFTITPVHDIEGQAPVDGYEIPDRHRQAVHLMTPADTFPHSPNIAVPTDRPHHRLPARCGGQGSRPIQGRANYGKPRRILHHRIKTFTGWEAKQPFPGIYIWRDPFGAHYLVDHTGTRRLGQTGEAA